MPSDRARVTYDPARKWRGLIAQQGRVTLEADWNEAAALDAERARALTLDFVGPVGTPSTPAPGYIVTAATNADAETGAIPGDLTIGAGTLYVGGERLALDASVTYSAQPEWLDASTSPLWVPPGEPGGGVTELVYLLASEQEVSAVEDPALLDVALGGPDTMQRLRVIQRFVRQTITAALARPGALDRTGVPPVVGPLPPIPIRPPIRRLLPLWWTELVSAAPAGTFSGLTLDPTGMQLLSTARLQVSFAGSGATHGLSQVSEAGGGYLGAENQLIRVMVASAGTQAGPNLVWGYDDASFLYRVKAQLDAATNQVTLTLANAPVDSYHQPAPGQAVELLRDSVWLSGEDYIAAPTGFVTTVIRGYDPTTRTLVIGGDAIDGTALPVDYLPPAPASAPNPPVITAITPATGPKDGGTLVTITGSGFRGATSVTFGGAQASGLLVQSDSALTAVAPALEVTPPTNVEVIVTTPAGASSPAQFNVVAPAAPTVSSIAPAAGVVSGGTLVTIAGSGFMGTTAVNFGTSAAVGLTVVDNETLTVFSPAAPSGQVTVTVVNPQGTATGQFTYSTDPPPQVTAIAPASGGLGGGTVVTITGSGFTGATAVDFGAGNAGTGLSVLSDTELTVVSPAAPPPGTSAGVEVTVTTPAGTSPADPAYRFSYQLEVTGVSPAVGPPSGGTVVTITGSGFTGATSVTFGGQPGTALAVQSDTQLTVTTPPGAGTADVIVGAPGGSSPQTSADRFTYETTPQLYLRVWQDVASPTGSAAGGTHAYMLDSTGVTVTVTSSGSQFHAGDFWRFAVRPLQPTTVLPERFLIAPQPPEGPRTWICPLANVAWSADGTATVTSSVPVFWNLATLTDAVLSHVQLPTPVVASISPAAGPPTGGTSVTVRGSGFTGATTVYFGPTTNPGTNLSVESDTELTVTSPPGSGTVDVRVITAGGESATGQADQFAYIGVTGVSPAVGPPGGGTRVTLTGSGFSGATAVEFGANPGTSLTVVSDTELTVSSPPGAGLAVITVTVGNHTSQPGGAGFAYVDVRGISPAAGPQTGGTQVTISGAGFSVAPVTAVTFGPFGTTNLTVINDATIQTATPAGNGTQPVIVTTSLGPTIVGGQTPSFAYQGKNTTKDLKDARDTKSLIVDKVTDKVTDKLADKLADKVTDKRVLAEKLSDVPAVNPRTGKVAEAKPPEGGGVPRLAAGQEPAGALPTPGATSGHPFIEAEERPDVGAQVVAEAEHDDPGPA